MGFSLSRDNPFQIIPSTMDLSAINAFLPMEPNVLTGSCDTSDERTCNCGKFFKTQSALRNHIFSTGHDMKCRCGKLFKSEKALKNHIFSTGHDKKLPSTDNDRTDHRKGVFQNIKKLNKPHGLNGRWVLTSQFKGTKSFGEYKCKTCENEWSSAHAFKTMGQQCRRCRGAKSKVYHIPWAMWVNYDHDKRESPVEDTEKPHDHNRCQACSVGECSQGRFF